MRFAYFGLGPHRSQGRAVARALYSVNTPMVSRRMTLVSSQGLRPAKSNENVLMPGFQKVRLGSRAFGVSGSFVQYGLVSIVPILPDLAPRSARLMQNQPIIHSELGAARLNKAWKSRGRVSV